MTVRLRSVQKKRIVVDAEAQMKVQVLGGGCSKCQMTARQVQEVAQLLGVPIEVEKVEQPAAIAAMGVFSTPAVAIDGKVVHTGGVPSREKIKSWLGMAALA